MIGIHGLNHHKNHILIQKEHTTFKIELVSVVVDIQQQRQTYKMGYYLPQYNFSVQYYNGQWILRVRNDEDVPATTSLEIAAIEGWAQTNREKFLRRSKCI
jgi:hypothetical protein